MPQVQVATEEYLRLKNEVTRLASMANKRLKRLETNNLTMVPSYMAWSEGGEIKFSVKGKDYNALKAEYWRVKSFIDARTSKVREANKYLKEMAEATGIEYNSIADLKEKASMFFELASKIEQYLNSMNMGVMALGYERIWSNINSYVKDERVDLSQAEDAETLLQNYLDYMERLEPVEHGQQGFSLNNGADWEFIEI